MKSNLQSFVSEGVQYMVIILYGIWVYVVLEIGLHVAMLYHHTTRHPEEVHEYQTVLQSVRDSVRRVIALHAGRGPEDIELADRYVDDE